MFDIKITYNDSFNKKTNGRLYQDCLHDCIEYTTTEFMEACKDEAPVRTGNLRDGHYVKVTGLNGIVGNDVEYAKYVIYGTSRQAPNNYPSRVVSRLNISGEVQSRLQESLITNGIL